MKAVFTFVSAAALVTFAAGASARGGAPHEKSMPPAQTQAQISAQTSAASSDQGMRPVMPAGTTTTRRVDQDRVQDSRGAPRATPVPEATTQSTQPPVSPAQD